MGTNSRTGWLTREYRVSQRRAWRVFEPCLATCRYQPRRADGRRFGTFNLVDGFSRESLAASERGLSEAQLGCILRVKTGDDLLRLRQCPAIAEHKPSWLLLTPPELLDQLHTLDKPGSDRPPKPTRLQNYPMDARLDGGNQSVRNPRQHHRSGHPPRRVPLPCRCGRKSKNLRRFAAGS